VLVEVGGDPDNLLIVREHERISEQPLGVVPVEPPVPSEIRRGKRVVRLSNLDKPYWPDERITKGETAPLRDTGRPGDPATPGCVTANTACKGETEVRPPLEFRRVLVLVPSSPGTTATRAARCAALDQARTYLGLAPAHGAIACLLPLARDVSERAARPAHASTSSESGPQETCSAIEDTQLMREPSYDGQLGGFEAATFRPGTELSCVPLALQQRTTGCRGSELEAKLIAPRIAPRLQRWEITRSITP
jgi:hypothetical protein